MTRREKHDPSSQAYTNALLEDIEDKFQAILEATQPIPKMQGQIASIQEQITEILTWEDNVKLIPATFEEVGALRKDVETIKAALKLIDRHDERIEKIEQRLSALEQRVH